jgi:hypothetical protein
VCRFLVMRVDQKKSTQIIRNRGRPRKTIIETIKKDLEFNELNKYMAYGRAL